MSDTFAFQNLYNKNYFEGWYFRFTDQKTNKNYAIISAITHYKDDPHVFIQSFHDTLDVTPYYRYPTNSFRYDNDTVFIDDNKLSNQHINYNLDDIQINLSFDNLITLKDLKGPNSAMGYLAKAPLECFQEVIILNGRAQGTINNIPVEGTIYMEKTYGRKFPTKWIWIQSNHNENDEAISFSVGKVPVLGVSIPGFLCILHTKENTYRFSTYNFSRIQIKNNVVTIKKGKYKLVLTPYVANTCKLVGPGKYANMNLDVYETIDGTCLVQLYHKNKQIYESSFTNAGIELMY